MCSAFVSIMWPSGWSISRPTRRSLLCKLAMVDQVKAGRTIASVAREFDVGYSTLHRMTKGEFKTASTWIPPGFELMLRGRNYFESSDASI
jgi:hypothetical protein